MCFPVVYSGLVLSFIHFILRFIAYTLFYFSFLSFLLSNCAPGNAHSTQTHNTIRTTNYIMAIRNLNLFWNQLLYLYVYLWKRVWCVYYTLYTQYILSMVDGIHENFYLYNDDEFSMHRLAQRAAFSHFRFSVFFLFSPFILYFIVSISIQPNIMMG